MRPQPLLDRRAVPQRHHAPLSVAHLQLLDIFRLESEPLVSLHANLPRAAELVEIIDIRGPERGLESAEDRVEGHAQALGLDPVDVGMNHRHTRAKVLCSPVSPD